MIFNFNGGGGNGGLTYNKDTDCYGAVNPFTGEWQDVINAGFQWNGYIYQQGIGQVLDLVSAKSKEVDIADITSVEKISMEVSPTGLAIVATNEKFNTTGYKTLKIDFDMSYENASYIGVYSIGLAQNNDLSDVVEVPVQSGSVENMSRQTISFDLTNYQDEFYFKAYLENTSSGYRQYMNFYNIWLEK